MNNIQKILCSDVDHMLIKCLDQMSQAVHGETILLHSLDVPPGPWWGNDQVLTRATPCGSESPLKNRGASLVFSG